MEKSFDTGLRAFQSMFRNTPELKTIDKGTYEVGIVKAAFQLSQKTQNPMLVLTFKILSVPGIETFTEYFTLPTREDGDEEKDANRVRALKRVYQQFNIKFAEDADSGAIIAAIQGAEAECSVVLKAYSKEDDREVNKISWPRYTDNGTK